MYVRQEAYFNAIPDGAKITRREQIENENNGLAIKNKSDDDSEDDGSIPDTPTVQERSEIPMPELTQGAEYLVAFLHLAGTATPTGTGLIGLSWQELEAWIRCSDMQNIVTPRDLKTIHLLSKVYASELSKASQKGAKAPFTPVVELGEEEREVISARVDDLFAGMIMAQKRD